MGWLWSIASRILLNNATVGMLKKIGATLLGVDDNSTQVALKQIDAEIAARADARTIRLATANFWEMRLLTFLIAACFTLHLVLVTLDTCFALHWRVAKFPAPFDQWEGGILLSFFGLYGAVTGISAIAGALARKL